MRHGELERGTPYGSLAYHPQIYAPRINIGSLVFGVRLLPESPLASYMTYTVTH